MLTTLLQQELRFFDCPVAFFVFHKKDSVLRVGISRYLVIEYFKSLSVFRLQKIFTKTFEIISFFLSVQKPPIYVKINDIRGFYLAVFLTFGIDQPTSAT